MTLPIFRSLEDLAWIQGSDPIRTPAPIVDGQTFDANQTNQVSLWTEEPDLYGGLPCIPLGEADLHVYSENPTTGEQHTPGRIYAGGVFDDLGASGQRYARGRQVSFSSTPPWIGKDAADPYFNIGFLSGFNITRANSPSNFFYEIHVPYTWWSVDVALFAWILCSFYASTPSARDYLDQEALERYSAGVHHYLRRRRLFTWRRVGESLMSHLKRLILTSGAMARWGGVSTPGGSVQTLGLGILDPEELLSLDHVYDADPAGDAGREMFLTSPVVVRSADEFKLNRVTTNWGGGWLRTFQYRSDLGASVYETDAQFPFTPAPAAPVGDWPAPFDGPANQHSDREPVSITAIGERAVERNFPEVIDAVSGDSLFPSRWTGDLRVVRWSMGPLHWDFDCGDVVHVSHPGLGLYGTEDLLVLEKTIDWETLHASITALELDLEVDPLTPTADELGDTCRVWLRPDVIVTDGGGNVTTWVDLSGNAHNATVPGGMTAPVQSPAAAGPSAFGAVDFFGNTGLEFATWDEEILSGATVLAVVYVDSFTGAGPLINLGGLSAGTRWGLDVYRPGGTNYLSLAHTSSQDLTFPRALGDQGLIANNWHLLTLVLESQVEGGPVANLLQHIQGQVGADAQPIADGNSVSQYLRDGSLFYNAVAGGEHTSGKLLELQVYNHALRPHQIRRLHAEIRSRYDAGAF